MAVLGHDLTSHSARAVSSSSLAAGHQPPLLEHQASSSSQEALFGQSSHPPSRSSSSLGSCLKLRLLPRFLLQNKQLGQHGVFHSPNSCTTGPGQSIQEPQPVHTHPEGGTDTNSDMVVKVRTSEGYRTGEAQLKGCGKVRERGSPGRAQAPQFEGSPHRLQGFWLKREECQGPQARCTAGVCA